MWRAQEALHLAGILDTVFRCLVATLSIGYFTDKLQKVRISQERGKMDD